MNPLLAPIFSRRSVRKFQTRPIPAPVIQDILEAGMAAPSACGKDPWEILVIQDTEKLQRISTGLPNGPMLAEAAAGFVVCGDIHRAHGQLLSYCLQDVSACIENMLLAISMLELGGVWLGVHPREERVAHLRTLFQLPPHILPVGILAVGYPDEEKAPRTRYTADRVHFEQW